MRISDWSSDVCSSDLLLRWRMRENLPGEFPFTGGVFHFKRENEDPTRMFAGEGDPFRTNRRFHLLSKDLPAKRLSTAFDSVTRSEERRVGKECVRTCRSRWLPDN